MRQSDDTPGSRARSPASGAPFEAVREKIPPKKWTLNIAHPCRPQGFIQQRDGRKVHMMKMARRRPMRMGSRGYSLMETVVATTIIGGLSAVAVPRIVDWATEARVAVIQSMEGAVHTASTMVHLGCAVRAGCHAQGGNVLLSLGGSEVTLARGYPAGGQDLGIANALEYKGFETVHLADSTAFRQQGAPHPERCAVIYQSPPADGMAPSIVSEVSGC
jgi:type II secretory pathway pseudopilin PulG